MNTDMSADFSSDYLLSDYALHCEGLGVNGRNCPREGFYVMDPLITSYPHYLCEDHIIEFAAGEELALLCGMGYYQ